MGKSTLALALTICTSLLGTAQADSTKAATGNDFWWPESIDLSPLRQNAAKSNPLGEDFDYAKAFSALDLNAVKADINAILTTSQDWWPADYGHYGPFFIRMAWHSAGVYRIFDGRGGAAGGQQRFEPLNSWPDNVNLDKARRLLWPVKQKYGSALSWADLMVLAGNVSLESMGFETYGFAGGREDDWEAEVVDWGNERAWLGNERYSEQGKLKKPLAAVAMGLIYVNPEGPNGVPDPLLAAEDIRDTFGRMAMNDEETVALIAGGHTFGKAHGAKKASDKCIGVEPAAAPTEAQGFGWKNRCGSGKGADTVTSGLEGAWSANPIAWTTQYLDNLFNFEWVQTHSPAGAIQWVPKNADQLKFVPDAHIAGKRHAPIMFTTDLALKFDPSYREISLRFKNNPEQYQQAFARAWFKLTHRDMGPRSRYLGSDVPQEALIWQDPVPKADYKPINSKDQRKLKQAILNTGLSTQQLVHVAWASASSYRSTDMRGGANGARIRLAPQRYWVANKPQELEQTLATLEQVQQDFNAQSRSRKVSMADLIVLAGASAIEQAAKAAGVETAVAFVPGRTDATAAQTDAASFEVLEPKADGFRNYYSDSAYYSPTQALVDKATLLNLSVPEMAVLVAGLRSLGITHQGKHGVLSHNTDQLSNDFFINLLDMATEWQPSAKQAGIYIGRDRATGEQRYTATPVDLMFGSHAELRAVSEVYAANNAKHMFVEDFVAAWVKVMRLDRFDL